jgi:hypothetical protein
VETVSRENEAPKVSRKTGKYKKVSVTDPDAKVGDHRPEPAAGTGLKAAHRRRRRARRDP